VFPKGNVSAKRKTLEVLLGKTINVEFVTLLMLARTAQQIEAEREQAEVAEPQSLNVSIVLKPKMVHARKKARQRIGEFSSHRVNPQGSTALKRVLGRGGYVLLLRQTFDS